MSADRVTTIVHLVRHGEVENPTGVLYGRLPDFHLSELGRQMAERTAESLRDRDIVHLRCSPLERAQETIRPLADALDLPVTTDGRVIEAGNDLEGRKVTPANLLKGGPATWWMFRNVARPTWGEAYTDIVVRMRAALQDAAAAALGHEAVIVSHQLPIWMARCDAEDRRLVHDPRKRQCTLASVTSFTYLSDPDSDAPPGGGATTRQGPTQRLSEVSYREPSADLLRPHQVARSPKFVAGA